MTKTTVFEVNQQIKHGIHNALPVSNTLFNSMHYLLISFNGAQFTNIYNPKSTISICNLSYFERQGNIIVCTSLKLNINTTEHCCKREFSHTNERHRNWFVSENITPDCHQTIYSQTKSIIASRLYSEVRRKLLDRQNEFRKSHSRMCQKIHTLAAQCADFHIPLYFLLGTQYAVGPSDVEGVTFLTEFIVCNTYHAKCIQTDKLPITS